MPSKPPLIWHTAASQPASGNIVWHGGKVSQVEREQLYHQRAATLWLTGLSGSGKSTLAFELERHLQIGRASCRERV